MLGLMLSSLRLGVPRILWGRHLTVFLGSQSWNQQGQSSQLTPSPPWLGSCRPWWQPP